MGLATVPAELAFLEVLARRWLAQPGDPAEGLLLLPSRRAARGLAEAFLRVAGGRAMLLPRMVGIAALDETPLLLDGMLALPPAMPQPRRLALLCRLILALDGADGAPSTVDRAWPLAGELARLMDEAELAGVDLGGRLPTAADPAYAVHWQRTLGFLQIVTSAWPAVLEAEGLMNPAARLVALLEGQAAHWAAHPPAGRVWAAGFSGGVPALFRLLGVVAGLPDGQVVLPGLDLGLAAAAWDGLAPTHPQDGPRRLLAGAGLARGEAAIWADGDGPDGDGLGARAGLLREALLPEDQLAGWADMVLPKRALDGVYRLDAADEQQEALAIALALRDALETPGHVAALVTPDRDLAVRVAAGLRRFGIVADDSAGRPLGSTPPAGLLRLLATAWEEGLAPVPLLALLKHPFTALGLAPAECRGRARWLDRAVLRGPRPGPGLAALRGHLAGAGKGLEGLAELLDRLEGALAPLAALPEGAAPLALLTALISAAENCAATDALPGDALLWQGADGEALSAHLAGLLAAMPALEDPGGRRPAERLALLLDAQLDGVVVRDARREGGPAHPRVFIWGLLEARLQTADLVVLGGLVEGVWPPGAEPGPWLSRPMRAAVGLPAPEELIGVAALDFLLAASAAPQVVLSCPQRRDRAPAVPARWLARLEARLAGAGLRLEEHPAAGWARRLDQPVAVRPASPPQPRPPVSARPRSLSVTEIETWQRDPYAIYARHVLRLRRLDDLDAQADAADYGALVHRGLGDFLSRYGAVLPADAAGALELALQNALSMASLSPVLAAWWRPRLARIAGWVAGADQEWRARFAPVAIAAECSGIVTFDGPAGLFTLRGRADRIDRDGDGRIAVFDYKTGTPPGVKSVRAGQSPQLPLEALMARMGGFGEAGEPSDLIYWRLTGGFVPGEISEVSSAKFPAGAMVDEMAGRLLRLIAAYDDAGRAYLAQPLPGQAPRFAEYGQLARLAEWQSAEEESEEEVGSGELEE